MAKFPKKNQFCTSTKFTVVHSMVRKVSFSNSYDNTKKRNIEAFVKAKNMLKISRI